MSSPTLVTNKPIARSRAPRINLDLKVESRTLGTNASYKLTTQDVSRSGLLLVWDRSVSHMPYLENTLLELVIDPDTSHLGESVSCLGKVVRKDHIKRHDKNVDVLGIQIVQIDNTDADVWEGCLSELETLGIDPAQKIDGIGGESTKKTHRQN